MTFERRSWNRADTGTSSHPSAFVDEHEDWIDRQRSGSRSNIEMVFHPYAFADDLVTTTDERRLCHKPYIGTVRCVCVCASSVRPTNDRFSHRFCTEIVFHTEIDNEIVYFWRDRQTSNKI